MKFTVSALMAASAAAIELDTQEPTWDTMVDVPTANPATNVCYWDEALDMEVCDDLITYDQDATLWQDDYMTTQDYWYSNDDYATWWYEDYSWYYDYDNWCRESFDNIDQDQDGWISTQDYAEYACNEWNWCVEDYSELRWFNENDNSEYDGWMTYDDYCPWYAEDYSSWYDDWYTEDYSMWYDDWYYEETETADWYDSWYYSDYYQNWCAESFENIDHDQDGWISIGDYAQYACTEWNWCVTDYSEFTWFNYNDNQQYDGWMTYDDYCPWYAEDYSSWYDDWYTEDYSMWYDDWYTEDYEWYSYETWCEENFNEIDADQDGWISVYDYAEHACNEWNWCTTDYSEFWWFYQYQNEVSQGWMTYSDYCFWYAEDYSSWYDDWYYEEDYSMWYDDWYSNEDYATWWYEDYETYSWCEESFNSIDQDKDGWISIYDYAEYACNEWYWCVTDYSDFWWFNENDNQEYEGWMTYDDYCSWYTAW